MRRDAPDDSMGLRWLFGDHRRKPVFRGPDVRSESVRSIERTPAG